MLLFLSILHAAVILYMLLVGGIVGLTLITPELSQIVTDFEEKFGIDKTSKRTHHHDFTGKLK